MKIVNRIAISVTPREPYMAWARAIAGGSAGAAASAEAFTSVYLVEAPDRFDPQQLIRKHHALIFEEQLSSWHRDESVWPSRRTFVMFSEWFEAKITEMVWDLGKQPLEAD
jgi:hypothetical protein